MSRRTWRRHNFTLDNYRDVLASDREPRARARQLGDRRDAHGRVALVARLGGGLRAGAPPCSGPDRILLVVLATQMFPGIVIVIPLFIVISQHRADRHVRRPGARVPVVHPARSSSGSSRASSRRSRASSSGRRPWTAPSTLQTFRLDRSCRSRCPPLFAAGVFAFIEAWNEFFFAMILTRINSRRRRSRSPSSPGSTRRCTARWWPPPCSPASPWSCSRSCSGRYILQGFVEGAVKG